MIENIFENGKDVIFWDDGKSTTYQIKTDLDKNITYIIKDGRIYDIVNNFDKFTKKLANNDLQFCIFFIGFGFSSIVEKDIDFSFSYFCIDIDIQNTTFQGSVNFNGAKCLNEVSFRYVKFYKQTNFNTMKLYKSISFYMTLFDFGVDLSQTQIIKNIYFDSCYFRYHSDFSSIVVSKATFNRTVFLGQFDINKSNIKELDIERLNNIKDNFLDIGGIV